MTKYNKTFLEAFDILMKHEGQYTWDEHDKGGETKYGISQRTYPHLDIKNLTLQDATDIYYKDYWENTRLDEIQSDVIAIKLFDLGVNMGIKKATLLCQRALRSAQRQVIEDGIMGPQTLKSINNSYPQLLLAALKSEAAGYYRLIAQSDYTQNKFLAGWLNRAYF